MWTWPRAPSSTTNTGRAGCPRGSPLRDIFARLATGYAKRFWKQGNRYLGETLYVDGRIRVKHSLEEFTLDRPVNDLDPGKYILLRYTDPVFEHLFYDVMRAADDGVILYGGYTGRFPDGKRGFTGLLMRRYSFAELGERDHEQLVRKGKRPAKDALNGVVADRCGDHVQSRDANRTRVLRPEDRRQGRHPVRAGRSSRVARAGVSSSSTSPLTTAPGSSASCGGSTIRRWLARGIRRSALFMRVSSSATPGLFRRDADKASGRYTMRYMLTRS